MHWVARNGHLVIVQTLIAAGAKVNQQDNAGRTPLHAASDSGHRAVEAVKALIAAGVDVNQSNNYGSTPLHLAAGSGYQTIAQVLIDAGANVNQPNNNGWIPLHWAACNGHQEVAQVLIIAGADVNRQNNEGRTPLQEAALYGYQEIIELINRVNASQDIAKKQVLTLLSAMHPRLGAESPVSLIEENQRNGLFHVIGQLFDKQHWNMQCINHNA